MNKSQKTFWFLFSIYGVFIIVFLIGKTNKKPIESLSTTQEKKIEEQTIPIKEMQLLSNKEEKSEFIGLTDEQAFSTLTLVSNETNKSCPLMVDKETRLDNMAALHNRIVQYSYTFVNLSKDEINIKELKNTLAPEIKNNIKTNPGLKEFRELKVTFVYDYKDKVGVHVFKTSVQPSDY